MKQTQTLHPAKLGEEAEVQHDVEEDRSAGKLRDIGKMALLLDGPRQRGAEQGEC